MSLYLSALLETLLMIGSAGCIAACIGLPLGLWLFGMSQNQLYNQRITYNLLSFCVNILRSVPFIILMIALIPLTRLIVGTSIGTVSAIVPLSIAAIPFFARLVEESLQSLPPTLLTAACSMGAKPTTILLRVLLPEIRLSLVSHITTVAVNLVTYSAMAGALGGGGLGSIAIHYGYQRFDIQVMCITVVLLVSIVQCIQWLGTRLRLGLERRYHLL